MASKKEAEAKETVEETPTLPRRAWRYITGMFGVAQAKKKLEPMSPMLMKKAESKKFKKPLPPVLATTTAYWKNPNEKKRMEAIQSNRTLADKAKQAQALQEEIGGK